MVVVIAVAEVGTLGEISVFVFLQYILSIVNE